MTPSIGTKVLFKTETEEFKNRNGQGATLTRIWGLADNYDLPSFEITFEDGSHLDVFGDELCDPETEKWLWEGRMVTFNDGGSYPCEVAEPWLTFMLSNGWTWAGSNGEWVRAKP